MRCVSRDAKWSDENNKKVGKGSFEKNQLKKQTYKTKQIQNLMVDSRRINLIASLLSKITESDVKIINP